MHPALLSLLAVIALPVLCNCKLNPEFLSAPENGRTRHSIKTLHASIATLALPHTEHTKTVRFEDAFSSDGVYTGNRNLEAVCKGLRSWSVLGV